MKLPSAGVRDHNNASMYNVGSSSYIWSSSASGSKATGLSFSSGGTSSDDVYRTYGAPLRCIKD
ncbi:MAG: hypothetical protein ACWA5P_02280 [bacterium]